MAVAIEVLVDIKTDGLPASVVVCTGFTLIVIVKVVMGGGILTVWGFLATVIVAVIIEAGTVFVFVIECVALTVLVASLP